MTIWIHLSTKFNFMIRLWLGEVSPKAAETMVLIIVFRMLLIKPLVQAGVYK